jgi:hypothetical protein
MELGFALRDRCKSRIAMAKKKRETPATKSTHPVVDLKVLLAGHMF